MKKLRLSSSEWEEMLKDISNKFHNECHRSLSDFSYTKADVNKFIKDITDESVIKPVIEITSDAYVTMYELVRQSSVEIQWHGLVEKLPPNVYRIYDILVFPQKNSAASTSSDQDEFAKWQMQYIMNPNFPIERMRLHGHSHVNMQVYSSSIDDGYQSELITKVEDGDYYIFLVLNKKMEMYPLLYDFNQQILFEGNDIEINVTNMFGDDIKSWCAKEIKDKCTTGFAHSYKSKKQPVTNLEIEKQQQFNQRIADIMQHPQKFINRR